MTTPTTYKAAGVDIDAGNALVDQIKPMVKSTARTGLMGGIGGFGGLFDLKACGYQDPVLVSATDGVGTKLAIAQATGIHDSIGIDLVAMCVNDLIVQGAEPLFFLDYFATGKLKLEEASAVIGGIAEGCKQAGCALIGGETAEMPAMYEQGKYDLAGFAVGAVEREKMLPKTDIIQGDIILGLASSGLHSNGFSLVRHIIANLSPANNASSPSNNLSSQRKLGSSNESPQNLQETYSQPCPWDASQTLGQALLVPTRIYVKSLLELLRAPEGDAVKAFAHITGGGLLENIPRILPDGMAAHISSVSWRMPAVFDWVKTAGGVEQQELYRTLNCGIGMVIIAEKTSAKAITERLASAGETVYTLGEVKNKTSQSVVMHD